MVKQLHTNLKFIDSFGFMSSSLSTLADNLSDGIHNNTCIRLFLTIWCSRMVNSFLGFLSLKKVL